jgi:hypothetical protein
MPLAIDGPSRFQTRSAIGRWLDSHSYKCEHEHVVTPPLQAVVDDFTVTVTEQELPAAPGGEVTVIFVPSGFTVKPVLGMAMVPKFTAEAPVNPAPLIVTNVPPTSFSTFGVTDVMIGP